jgi:glycosyltransferase involved in cell wall biosynthesis
MAALHTHLPRISVVVPSYNQGRFLPEALDSIFRQDYPDLEVIVMDGGSTDDSVSILRRYAPRLKHWQSEKDGGQSAAINAGMRHGSGQLVAWLNSDDLYWQDALWAVGRAYAEHPRRGLYVGNGLRYDQHTGVHTPFCDRHVAFNRAALVHGTDYLLQPSTFFLREAWEGVGGLDPGLHYCMDWDLFIRIAQRYPAVVLQEFLGVSREYDETKTRSGKMKRVAEIVRMVQSHTGKELTPGSLLFLCETLLEVAPPGASAEFHRHLRDAHGALARKLSLDYGGGHGFPEQSDPQDVVHLPFAHPSPALPARGADAQNRPSISIVIPTIDKSDDLEPTLDSIRNQDDPAIEMIVSDNVVESKSPTGAAAAINRGLAQAGGEILAWLHPGDLLAAGATDAVGRAFAEDPDLDLVYGNAAHIDGQGHFCLEDHGRASSGVWLGQSPVRPQDKSCGADLARGFPQPTVFFRRRLLDRCGGLNESLRCAFDHELFLRCTRHAKIQKIERLQAFIRVRSGPSTRWERFAELYRLDRADWPRLFSREFPHVLREFLKGYLRRKFGGRPRRAVFWGAAVAVGLSALTGVGNPERWWNGRRGLRLYLPLFVPKRIAGRFHSLFCAPRFPDRPQCTASEQREFQVLQALRAFSSIEFFAQDSRSADHLGNIGADVVDAVHTAKSIRMQRPDLIVKNVPLKSRLVAWLRRLGVPVPGTLYPRHTMAQLPDIYATCRAPIQMTLERNRPDFLFVSPQFTPLLLTLATESIDTRVILIAHAVETQRMQAHVDSRRGPARLLSHAEIRRAREFETANLARCDGILAATQQDRLAFARFFDFPLERIRVVDSTDARGLRVWLTWLRKMPRRHEAGAALSLARAA